MEGDWKHALNVARPVAKRPAQSTILGPSMVSLGQSRLAVRAEPITGRSAEHLAPLTVQRRCQAGSFAPLRLVALLPEPEGRQFSALPYEGLSGTSFKAADSVACSVPYGKAGAK